MNGTSGNYIQAVAFGRLYFFTVFDHETLTEILEVE